MHAVFIPEKRHFLHRAPLFKPFFAPSERQACCFSSSPVCMLSYAKLNGFWHQPQVRGWYQSFYRTLGKPANPNNSLPVSRIYSYKRFRHPSAREFESHRKGYKGLVYGLWLPAPWQHLCCPFSKPHWCASMHGIKQTLLSCKCCHTSREKLNSRSSCPPTDTTGRGRCRSSMYLRSSDKCKLPVSLIGVNRDPDTNTGTNDACTLSLFIHSVRVMCRWGGGSFMLML